MSSSGSHLSKSRSQDTIALAYYPRGWLFRVADPPRVDLLYLDWQTKRWTYTVTDPGGVGYLILWRTKRRITYTSGRT